MAIINMNNLTIEQLNDLITCAATVLSEKVDSERQERERILNNDWGGLKTLIKEYEDNYTILMRVKNSEGCVRHFVMNGDTDVTFELCKLRKKGD